MLSLQSVILQFFLFAFLLYSLFTPFVLGNINKCGYAKCEQTKSNMLNVHIVAHTHDDEGWLKTFDQYYYGLKNDIQYANVRKIITSVVTALLQDPKRRFVYAESAFFFKWWDEQTIEMQEKVKMLVNEGRLEFVGGAWSVNDEATTHYQSIIDQFAWGLKRLNDTFGECGRPKVGWQIDPFGHSSEMATMLTQMDYDGFFFGRIDYADKHQRLKTKKAEMIWQPSKNMGETSTIFAGLLFNLYHPPEGFCFDSQCGNTLLRGDVNGQVLNFFDIVRDQSKYYRSNNIMLTMGGDFQYHDAVWTFKNLDRLISYANEFHDANVNINLLYSTPSCYLKALHETNITWPLKTDDFFPYASSENSYWTGYFTSRPNLKRYERDGNHFLQVCKQLTALLPKKTTTMLKNLNHLRQVMGIIQHHDGITGTEKQHVADDYASMLSAAMLRCSANTRAVLNHLISGLKPMPKGNDDHAKKHYHLEFRTCSKLNISACEVSEQNKQFILTLYNPLERETEEYVRIPVVNLSYTVQDHNATVIEHQIVPIPNTIQNLTQRESKARYELVFLAKQLPPLGYKSYYITEIEGNVSETWNNNNVENLNDLKSIGNEHINLTFDTNNFLTGLTLNGTTHLIKQEFLYYVANGSGAYMFRPLNQSIPVTNLVKMQIYRGPLVEEVHQQFNDWISQVIRVYRGQQHVEFDWLIGPIPIQQNEDGKEIITRFNTNIHSAGIFYTDSNGREMMKRQRNHRNTWNLTMPVNESANYYPITTKIALEDEEHRLAILTDRAQGGSSTSNGSLEIMLHRRLLKDDDYGVEEALNEMAFGQGIITRGSHYLLLGSSQLTISPTLHVTERLLQLQKLLPTWKFFNDAMEYNVEAWKDKFTNIFSSITTTPPPLPPNVHLLTYEPWQGGNVLIRFEHIFEKNEDPELSKVVTINVKEIFSKFEIVDMRETTLDGSKWLSDKQQRLKFKVDAEEKEYLDSLVKSENESGNQHTKSENVDKFEISLSPMQIRTFVLYLS